MDCETFDILGRWEIDRGPQNLHYGMIRRRLLWRAASSLYPDEFAALDAGPKQPMGGGIVDLPVPVSQPESTAAPPVRASPEWQHELNEGIKAELRQRGITSGGPLRATATIGVKPWSDV